jgi:hypothetical protein
MPRSDYCACGSVSRHTADYGTACRTPSLVTCLSIGRALALLLLLGLLLLLSLRLLLGL